MSLSARPPTIITYGKTTNIYLLSLSALTVGTVHGEDVVRSTLFGHRMTHFSATIAIAGSGDTIHFGSLEFPALPPVGMWVPPVSKPSQAFLFGSLDYIADRLGVLHFCEETHDRHLSERCPPLTPGRETSTAWHLRFFPSKLSAQTPL